MNLRRRGWFQRYLAFRRSQPLPRRLPSHGVRLLEDDTGVHNEMDQAIYFFLEPTGLLYGTPVAHPFPDIDYPGRRYHSRQDRALLIHLDATFAALVADRAYMLEGLGDEGDPLEAAAEIVREYYLSFPVEAGVLPDPLAFIERVALRRPRPDDAFEAAFRARTVVPGNLLVLRAPLANIFLFLDLYHCLLWQRKRLMEGEAGAEALEALHLEQAAQREALLKFVAAMAFADGAVDAQSRRLLDRLMGAAQLPEGKLWELSALVENGLTLPEIELPSMPWLVRRFILGQAVMATLLDRSMSVEEEALLGEATQKLGLWDGEVAQSRAAVEVFLLAHRKLLGWDRTLPHLYNLADDLREQASIALRLNLNRIVTEIRETHELYELLMKSRTEPLTAEERRKVREQLTDILKTVPALAIWALPGGAVMLPILIRLLPFNLLPSSFED